MHEIFRLALNIDVYPSIELSEEHEIHGPVLENMLERGDSIALEWTCPKVRWDRHSQLPDFAYVLFASSSSSSIGVSERAVALIKDCLPQCGEMLSIDFDHTDGFQLFHLYGSDVFPTEHDHHTVLGDFATAIAEENVRPLFREIIRTFEGNMEPGVYRYCTGEFRERYEALGLSGLIFEPYWPLDKRIDYLLQKDIDRAVARERGKRVRGNPGDSSTMPKGPVKKAKVTWKKNKHPTPDQLASYLWESVIDYRMNGEWLGDAIGANTPDALGITQLAAEAVTRLLDMQVDRNVLCHLARAICFEAITRTFATLEDTGIDWPDGDVDWESLQIAMTQQATLGKDGKLGGWPPK